MTDKPKKDKKKQGSSSREKGARGERELAEILRDKYGYDTRRGYVFYKQPDVVGLEGIHIEVKRVERLSIDAAWKQSVEGSEKKQDGDPAVFHRKNRREWLVTISLKTFMKLYGAWRVWKDSSFINHSETQ